MTTKQKTFNFTGVNAESNKKLITDVKDNIIKIIDNAHVPSFSDELVQSIEAVKERLELYQGFNDYQKEVEYDISPRLIAYIVFKDATVIPIDSDGSPEVLDAEEVALQIHNAIAEGDDFTKIGIFTVNVNHVWMVRDYATGEEFIINEDNNPHIIPITKETILQMDNIKLKDTMGILLELISNSNDEDEEFENDVELLDHAIDELDQRYCNAQYEKERTSNILYAFIDRYKLYEKFEQLVEVIKEEQKNPEDTYEVAKELYSDMDEFIQEYPWLRADWGKNQQTN